MKSNIITLLIILNSLIIFTEPLIPSLSEVFLFLDIIFNVIFCFDIILSFIKDKTYFKSTVNIIDAFIVVGATLSPLLPELNFLIILRMFRLFKIVRLFKFIPNIDKLLISIKNVFKTSVFILASFTLYMFIVSNLSYILYTNVSKEYYGNPIESLYTTFKIFTLEGWNTIPESMEDKLSKTQYNLTRIYFVLIILSGGIFGLSLVNSIFVDSVLMDDNDRILKELEDIKKKLE